MAREPKRPETPSHELPDLEAMRHQWIELVDAANVLRAITEGDKSRPLTTEETEQFQTLLEDADRLEAQIRAREDEETTPQLTGGGVQAEEGERDQEDDIPKLDNKPHMPADILAEADTKKQWDTLWVGFCKAVDAIVMHEKGTEQATKLRQAVDDFSDKARAVLGSIEGLVDKIDLSLLEMQIIAKAGRTLNKSRKERLHELMRRVQQGVDEHTSIEQKGESMAKLDELEATIIKLTKRAETAEEDASDLNTKLEEATDQIQLLTKRAETAESQATKLQHQLDENDPEAIWKGVSPQLRARIEKAEAERDEEKNARLKQEYIQKASAYKALPINPDDDWEVFRDMQALSAKAQRRIEAILKAAEEGMLHAKLFGEIGHSGTGEPQGDALDQLNKLATERVEKGLSKTMAIAWDDVVQANPGLYRQYKVERRGVR